MCEYSGEDIDLCPTLLRSNHQTFEEGVVAQPRLAEVFGRDLLALFPLALQRGMFVRKHPGELLDDLRYQRIRLLDSRAWFVHKLALDLMPTRAKMIRFNLWARYKHRRAILPYYNGCSPVTSIARGVASVRQLGESSITAPDRSSIEARTNLKLQARR